MNYFLLLFLCIVTQSYGMSIPILSEEDCACFTVVSSSISHAGTDAAIAMVTDGTPYILKQIHDPSLDEQFLLINDCVASTIGYQAGIPVNQVFFIPYNVGAQLKFYPGRAATLHTYIPGTDLEIVLPSFLPDYFSLQQCVINPNSPWQQKYPLQVHEQGLTSVILESMSYHKVFSQLVALDTFIGNSDRSRPNIFYDAQNNAFYGIDQAAAFVRELPLYAGDRLKEFLDQDYFNICAHTIIDGLRIYRDTLLYLVCHMSYDMVIQTMEQLVPYLSEQALEDKQVQERIYYHKKVIESNYRHTNELICLLESVIP